MLPEGAQLAKCIMALSELRPFRKHVAQLDGDATPILMCEGLLEFSWDAITDELCTAGVEKSPADAYIVPHACT